MVIPFHYVGVTGGLSPYGASNLVFDQALPPSFLPVRVLAPNGMPILVASWASGAATIFEPLARDPGRQVRIVSVRDGKVTGGREGSDDGHAYGLGLGLARDWHKARECGPS